MQYKIIDRKTNAVIYDGLNLDEAVRVYCDWVCEDLQDEIYKPNSYAVIDEANAVLTPIVQIDAYDEFSNEFAGKS